MSKKMKVVLATIAVVLVLTLGTTAVVLAQDGSNQPPQPPVATNPMWSKVAKILGISEADLTDAFNQARQQLRQENFDERLAQAVNEGIITQAEADEIGDWWAERPPAVDKLQGFCFNNAKQARKAFGGQFRIGKGMGPGMMGGGWRWQQQPPTQTQ